MDSLYQIINFLPFGTIKNRGWKKVPQNYKYRLSKPLKSHKSCLKVIILIKIVRFQIWNNCQTLSMWARSAFGALDSWVKIRNESDFKSSKLSQGCQSSQSCQSAQSRQSSESTELSELTESTESP